MGNLRTSETVFVRNLDYVISLAVAFNQSLIREPSSVRSDQTPRMMDRPGGETCVSLTADRHDESTSPYFQGTTRSSDVTAFPGPDHWLWSAQSARVWFA
jgi:hypothetical protein